MPLDPDPKSQPVSLPQWGAFRMAMLSNASYQRVSGATTQQRAVSRIESYFATEAENWAAARMFWQQMIAGCPASSKPSAAEAAVWTQIAQQTTMPIRFNADGQMESL
jgi:hypothetical protein